jgi:hypothetical protein
MRRGIWASTATFYANILVNRESGKSMFGVKVEKLSNLKIFDEIVAVTTKKKIQGKLNDRFTVCMFVGYPQNHSDDA